MLASDAHGLVRAEEAGIGGGVPAATGQQKPPEATSPGNAMPCSARKAMQCFFRPLSADAREIPPKLILQKMATWHIRIAHMAEGTAHPAR